MPSQDTKHLAVKRETHERAKELATRYSITLMALIEQALENYAMYRSTFDKDGRDKDSQS